jgi:putative inorganic carbon (hco3(-)) transporter
VLQTPVAQRDHDGTSPALALSPTAPPDPEVLQTPHRSEPRHPHLKWIALLLFTQCFLYKDTGFVPSLEVGVTLSPDRLVFMIILMLAVWRFTRGELHFPTLGKVGWYMLLFALICTVSSFLKGTGSDVLYRLFDFNYNPFVIFILAKSIPHSREKLAFLSYAFLAVGAYLAVNGIFERFGPQVLVWPKYILDPSVGIQFGRTRGSFASSEALGQALAVCFLFYALYATRAQGIKRCWTLLMILLISVVVYATNQRAAWISFGLCLGLLAITKTGMRRVSRVFLGVAVLGFLSGVGTHFSFWEDATLFSRRQNTVSYRKVNNLTTLEMGKAHPIFGIGFGNFRHAWPQYFRPEGSDVRDLDDGNHNTFLGLFAETGLVGLIPYLMILYYMFRVGLRVYRQGGGLDREFALVFLLAVLVYIVGGNFSDYRSGQFFNTSLFLLFGTVAGIEVHMASATHREAEELSGKRLETDVESFWADKFIKSQAV